MAAQGVDNLPKRTREVIIMEEETQVTETEVQDVAPENNPKVPENNPKESEETTNSTTNEPEDYSFDADAEVDGGDTGGDTEEGAEEFCVEWPEGYEASDDLTEMVNKAARDAGVSDKALGVYTARMIEQLEEKQAAVLAADDAALKEAWGRDYLANKKAAREFMGRVMREHGLGKEDVQHLANPKGFKLLYVLSQKVGGGAVHLGRASSDEVAWAKAAMGDREHPDHKALTDVRDPRHKEVTRRYFRANGARV